MNWPATILLVFIESLLIANHLKTIRDPGSLKRLAQAVGQKDAIEDNCGRCFLFKRFYQRRMDNRQCHFIEMYCIVNS